jgi:ADP-heptose:LPS heptosyltransferase
VADVDVPDVDALVVGAVDIAAGDIEADAVDAGTPNTAGAVLALRALGLGDALTGIPALRGIRRAWRDRRLVLATPAPLGRWLQELGVIDDVLVTDGLAPLEWPPAGWTGRGGHIAVNLHGSGPQSHRLLESTGPVELVAFSSPAAGHLDGPQWRHDEHEVDRWCRLMMTFGGRCDSTDLRLQAPAEVVPGDVVLLHPGAASGSRRWPADRWARLAAQLAADGCPVVLTGGPTEIALCNGIAAQAIRTAGRSVRRGQPGPSIRVEAGTLDLPGLTRLVASAQLMVCGDTGVAHLATALGTPSVLLFGPTPARWWGPRIDLHKHQVLWHGDASYLGDAHGDTIDPALDAITDEEVIEAARRQITMNGADRPGTLVPRVTDQVVATH